MGMLQWMVDPVSGVTAGCESNVDTGTQTWASGRIISVINHWAVFTDSVIKF